MTKILCFVGEGRSGSSIFEAILGQLPGFFSAGEMHSMWHRGLIENRKCSCGRPFRECPVWSQIFESAYGHMPTTESEPLNRRVRRASSNRVIPILVAENGLSANRSRFQNEVDLLARLYGSVASVTQSRVIVDSSKMPGYALLLERMPGFQVYYLHFVRDPRGVVVSWKRRKHQEGDLYMKQRSLPNSLARWVYRNEAAHRMFSRHGRRYLQIRYEDFVKEPSAVVQETLQFLDESDVDLSFIDGKRVQVAPTHASWGNAVRFSPEIVTLKNDDAWRNDLSGWRAKAVAAGSYPWRRRYGYS
jgi:Sulfotransferase family